jgi:excisionase family DNA binding protein
MSDAKVSEVAEHLGLHPETVRILTRSNEFPNAYKTGKGNQSNHIRIPWADVEDYRKKQPRASR